MVIIFLLKDTGTTLINSLIKKNSIIFNYISDLKSIWFWLSLIELIIIIILLKRISVYNQKIKPLKIIDKSNKNNVDIDNVINSIHHAKSLYKELSRKYHPDRFVNTELENTAKEIFQEIIEHERNYEKLINIKIKAEKVLKINL